MTTIDLQNMTEESQYFWASFKAAATNAATDADAVNASPDQLSGGKYLIGHGVTFVQGVSQKTGTTLEFYKACQPDDEKYLVEAGFAKDKTLDIPTIPYSIYNKK